MEIRSVVKHELQQPNIHRRRDATVELNRVGVGGVNPILDDCRRVRSHRHHDATRLRCWQICSDSSRLSPTSCEFRTHRRRDWTRQMRRVGVGGVYWALKGTGLCVPLTFWSGGAEQCMEIRPVLRAAADDWPRLGPSRDTRRRRPRSLGDSEPVFVYPNVW